VTACGIFQLFVKSRPLSRVVRKVSQLRFFGQPLIYKIEIRQWFVRQALALLLYFRGIDMNPQISSSPTPKKVAFSPVRLGPSNAQSQPGTPPSYGKTGAPRSILKMTSSPVKYNPENEISVVLDSSSVVSIANNDRPATSLDIYIQRLLVAREEDRLHAYSSFYGALKQDPNSDNLTEDMVRSALETCLKDMESNESIVMYVNSLNIGAIWNQWF
jgi:hypothetical protein